MTFVRLMHFILKTKESQDRDEKTVHSQQTHQLQKFIYFYFPSIVWWVLEQKGKALDSR